VEGGVGVDEGVAVAAGPGLLAPGQQGVEPVQILRGAATGREARGSRLQRAAQLGHVRRVRGGEAALHHAGQFAGRDHPGARALADVQQAVVGQRPDGLAHGVAGHAELGDQLRFRGDARTDRPRARGDLLTQPGDHLVGESYATRDWTQIHPMIL
jgi:hypothetical protein